MDVDLMFTGIFQWWAVNQADSDIQWSTLHQDKFVDQAQFKSYFTPESKSTWQEKKCTFKNWHVFEKHMCKITPL